MNNESKIKMNMFGKEYEVEVASARFYEVIDDESEANFYESALDGLKKEVLTDEEINAVNKFVNECDKEALINSIKEFAKGKTCININNERVFSDDKIDELMTILEPFKIVANENKVNVLFLLHEEADKPYMDLKDALGVDLIAFYLDENYNILNADYSYGRDCKDLSFFHME